MFGATRGFKGLGGVQVAAREVFSEAERRLAERLVGWAPREPGGRQAEPAVAGPGPCAGDRVGDQVEVLVEAVPKEVRVGALLKEALTTVQGVPSRHGAARRLLIRAANRAELWIWAPSSESQPRLDRPRACDPRRYREQLPRGGYGTKTLWCCPRNH